MAGDVCGATFRTPLWCPADFRPKPIELCCSEPIEHVEEGTDHYDETFSQSWPVIR